MSSLRPPRFKCSECGILVIATTNTMCGECWDMAVKILRWRRREAVAVGGGKTGRDGRR